MLVVLLVVNLTESRQQSRTSWAEEELISFDDLPATLPLRKFTPLTLDGVAAAPTDRSAFSLPWRDAQLGGTRRGLDKLIPRIYGLPTSSDAGACRNNVLETRFAGLLCYLLPVVRVRCRWSLSGSSLIPRWGREAVPIAVHEGEPPPPGRRELLFVFSVRLPRVERVVCDLR